MSDHSYSTPPNWSSDFTAAGYEHAPFDPAVYAMFLNALNERKAAAGGLNVGLIPATFADGPHGRYNYYFASGYNYACTINQFSAAAMTEAAATGLKVDLWAWLIQQVLLWSQYFVDTSVNHDGATAFTCLNPYDASEAGTQLNTLRNSCPRQYRHEITALSEPGSEGQVARLVCSQSIPTFSAWTRDSFPTTSTADQAYGGKIMLYTGGAWIVHPDQTVLPDVLTAWGIPRDGDIIAGHLLNWLRDLLNKMTCTIAYDSFNAQDNGTPRWGSYGYGDSPPPVNSLTATTASPIFWNRISYYPYPTATGLLGAHVVQTYGTAMGPYQGAAAGGANYGNPNHYVEGNAHAPTSPVDYPATDDPGGSDFKSLAASRYSANYGNGINTVKGAGTTPEQISYARWTGYGGTVGTLSYSAPTGTSPSTFTGASVWRQTVAAIIPGLPPAFAKSIDWFVKAVLPTGTSNVATFNANGDGVAMNVFKLIAASAAAAATYAISPEMFAANLSSVPNFPPANTSPGTHSDAAGWQVGELAALIHYDVSGGFAHVSGYAGT